MLCRDEIARRYYESDPKGKATWEMSGHAPALPFLCPSPLRPSSGRRMNTEGRVSATKPSIVNARPSRSSSTARASATTGMRRIVTVLEGVFARGDRRMARRIADDAYQKRLHLYDAWGRILSAMTSGWRLLTTCGLSVDFYTYQGAEPRTRSFPGISSMSAFRKELF